MMYLRTFITILYLVIYLIISLPVMLIALIIGKIAGAETKDRFCNTWVRWGFQGVCFFSGVKVTYIGEENVPTDQAVLYVANHRSIFDIVITYAKMKRPCGYIAKNSLEKIPVLSTLAKMIHCQFIDREDIRQGLTVILNAIADVKKGISIFIFPEGTRCRKEGEFLPFHAGSFKIATKAGCPIIPVTIVGSGHIFEEHFPGIVNAHVIVEYGKPIIPSELDAEQKKHIAEYTSDLIRKTYEKNLPML